MVAGILKVRLQKLIEENILPLDEEVKNIKQGAEDLTYEAL